MLMLKYVVLWHRKVNINKFLSVRRALLFTILKRLNSVTLCFINRELTLNDAMRRMDDKFREFRDRSINAESDGRWHVFCVLHEDSWRDCGSTSIPRQRLSLEIGHGLVLSRTR